MSDRGKNINNSIILGVGSNPKNNLIQKANPLLSLSRSELSLSEFKIFDVYLSRINSHEPEKRTVRLEKGEIEDYLGLTQIKTPDLKKRLQGLGRMVPIDDPECDGNNFKMIALFEEISCVQDDDGVWQVDLTCTKQAMKYIFNIEKLGYLRYAFKSVVGMRSRYTYTLFLYLESNRSMHLSWEVSVEELRDILGVNEEYYNKFKTFNQKVLTHARNELYEKTKCRFTYEKIKKGRKVVKVRFTLEPLSIEPKEIEATALDSGKFDDHIELLRSACTPYGDDEPEFSREQILQLYEYIITLPQCKLPASIARDGIEIQRYHYLAQKYSVLNVGSDSKAIKNRYAYLLGIIRNDAGID